MPVPVSTCTAYRFRAWNPQSTRDPPSLEPVPVEVPLPRTGAMVVGRFPSHPIHQEGPRRQPLDQLNFLFHPTARHLVCSIAIIITETQHLIFAQSPPRRDNPTRCAFELSALRWCSDASSPHDARVIRLQGCLFIASSYCTRTAQYRTDLAPSSDAPASDPLLGRASDLRPGPRCLPAFTHPLHTSSTRARHRHCTPYL